MQKQHGLHLLVLHKAGQDRRSAFARRNDPHELGQAEPMEIEDEREKLPRGFARDPVWMRVQRTDQGFESLNRILRIVSIPGRHC